MSSATARCISSVSTNPFTVLKIRAEVIGDDTYSRMANSIRIIYKNEGIAGFFKGSLAMIIRDFPFGGIFYLTYLYSNTFMDLYFETSFKYLLSGMIAGVTATTITQPIEIVKSRLMVDTRKNSGKDRKTIMWHLRTVYKEDGLSGYARGILPRLLRKPIINASTFFFYEFFDKIEKQKKNL